MRFWPWPRRDHPDQEAFLDILRASHPGKRYPKIDKYRDFRRLFLDTEEGRRVLYEILSFCGMYRSAAAEAKFDPNYTMFLNGRQDIAFRLLDLINNEPVERPTSTKEN